MEQTFNEGDYVRANVSTVTSPSPVTVVCRVIAVSGVSGVYYVQSLDGELSFLKSYFDLELIPNEEATLLILES